MPDPESTGKEPLVSVVVVTLNNITLLRRCLSSLEMQNYSATEIIVVDNGSTEPVTATVAAEFPGATVIRLDENTGFAGGNNRGIEHANGKYIALLNNDAVADPQWLSEMVSVAEKEPHVGAVASLVIDGNDPSALDSFGAAVAVDGMSRQCMRGKPVPTSTNTTEVLCASGCACLFRKEALDQIGLFDERFFAYCEDTDLCLRMQRAAWRIVRVPTARVTHYYSRTGGAHSLKKVFWVERNHYWVALKNFPVSTLALLPLTSLWRHILQIYILMARKGDLHRFVDGPGPGPVVAALCRAALSMFAGVPEMLRKRAAFRPPNRMGDRQFARLLVRHRMSLYTLLVGTNRRP